MHGLAKPAYLSGSLFSALPGVALYCAPSGVRVVSEVHRSRFAGPFANQIRDLDVFGALHARVARGLAAPRKWVIARPMAFATCDLLEDAPGRDAPILGGLTNGRRLLTPKRKMLGADIAG